jgi:hypothetical protein
MNKKLEIEEFNNFVDDLSEDSKKLIDIEPTFVYKGQIIRLDFIGKADRLFLTKAFEEIEKDRNEKIDFDKFKKDAEQEVLEVRKYMAKLQSKEFITIKEFTELFGASKTSQQDYRGRRKDKNPLPYKQEKEGGRILYNMNEVRKWRDNGYK